MSAAWVWFVQTFAWSWMSQVRSKETTSIFKISDLFFCTSNCPEAVLACTHCTVSGLQFHVIQHIVQTVCCKDQIYCQWCLRVVAACLCLCWVICYLCPICLVCLLFFCSVYSGMQSERRYLWQKQKHTDNRNKPAHLHLENLQVCLFSLCKLCVS